MHQKTNYWFSLNNKKSKQSTFYRSRLDLDRVLVRITSVIPRSDSFRAGSVINESVSISQCLTCLAVAWLEKPSNPA